MTYQYMELKYMEFKLEELEKRIEALEQRAENIEKQVKEDKVELEYAKFRCALPIIMDTMRCNLYDKKMR